MLDFVLHALELDGEGGASSMDHDALAVSLQSDATSWIHLDAGAEQSRQWLLDNLALPDELIIDALLAEETRPRLVNYEEGTLIILRGVNLNEDAHPEDMVSIRLWVYGSNIVSARVRRLKAVTDIRENLETGRGPKSAADVLTTLITRLFERMEPALRSDGKSQHPGSSGHHHIAQTGHSVQALHCSSARCDCQPAQC